MRKAMFFKMKEALYHSSGLGSAGHGIAFSLPVDRTVGLS